jgi:hypothetical protein
VKTIEIPASQQAPNGISSASFAPDGSITICKADGSEVASLKLARDEQRGSYTADFHRVGGGGFRCEFRIVDDQFGGNILTGTFDGVPFELLQKGKDRLSGSGPKNVDAQDLQILGAFSRAFAKRREDRMAAGRSGPIAGPSPATICNRLIGWMDSLILAGEEGSLTCRVLEWAVATFCAD